MSEIRTDLADIQWEELHLLASSESWKRHPVLLTQIMDQHARLCADNPELQSREFGTPDFWDAIVNGFDEETTQQIGEFRSVNLCRDKECALQGVFRKRNKR